MMLTALVELAKRRGLLANPDFEEKAIDFVIVIDAAGGFIQRISRQNEKGRGTPVAVPRGPKKSVNVAAAFAWGTAKYVLGLGEPGKEERAQQCRSAFFALIEQAEQRTHDAGLAALVSFYRRYDENLVALFGERPREQWTGSENLVFQLSGDTTLLHHRPLVSADWSAQRVSDGASSARALCLATGVLAAPARLHPSVKGLVPYGGQSSGSSLVSFNAPAFESYGLEQGANAPVSRAAAEAYATAINWMLEPDPTTKRRHRYGIPLGDGAVGVFWVNGDDQAMDEVASFFFTPSDPDQAIKAARSAWDGIERSVDSARFCSATLGGNAARVVVRDWLTSTMGDLKRALRQYFGDLALAHGDDRDGTHPLPIAILTKALDPPGSASIPPTLGAKLFRVSLDAHAPFPREILRWALMRLRVPPTSDQRDKKSPEQMLHARCALIKATLRRTARAKNDNQPEITMALDQSNTNAAYVLGRLFAVLERLQGAAQNDLNATIRDRYFGAASTTPASVFGRLMDLGTKHLSKLGGGLEHYFDERLRTVARQLEGDHIPSHLSLEEQGLFSIGYFHERDWLIEDAKARGAQKQAAHTTPPTA